MILQAPRIAHSFLLLSTGLHALGVSLRSEDILCAPYYSSCRTERRRSQVLLQEVCSLLCPSWCNDQPYEKVDER
ncbi:hypothetical protein QBC46DRAFT_370364 [Diplogelasinospora grovesii]|uniref:Secreted protein n=1 Tax=Diplogelasinospora grovesii TaxID=303347 RepID=A0AAN6S9D9_9PEZI|nr:hypothetical protein QBC46DRAFT_370364 [Diplogelasinospora grovesii]